MQLFLTVANVILVAFILALMAGAYFIVRSKRAARAIAGSNFPPGIPPVGVWDTFAATGNTAAVTTKTLFTAPVSGLYLVAAAAVIRTTNGAGTIAMTLGTPHAGNVTIATQSGSGTITAIEKDPAPATPTDGFSAAIPVWMNATDTITLAAAVSGLTGTTYDLYVAVGRVL